MGKFFGESMVNGDNGALVHIYRNDLSPFLRYEPKGP